MRRVMIVGQPGSGKSTLARALGARTGLPVVHMDHIHWQPGWVERTAAQKDRLCAEVEAREEWIFEGGHSRSYANRVARADLLIWVDVPVALRLWRVTRRTLTGLGKSRPDLPSACPERLRNLPGFWRFIWATRHSSRARIARLVQGAPPELRVVHLRSLADVRAFLARLPDQTTRQHDQG
ncbi:AAA family ATPase [Fertoebacter nigrum]|uniref:AAA family ATPase n=1 Tax=Fertoeibacter niger TaxID=2656921 RepID=A0A8X8KS55_9RHOB|nr:AAA family ATPase [Fertoeibacter niger]NUB46057.1 AAA family ATPase [Fertoeibacter niger]